MHLGQHIDLLILLIQQIFQFPDLQLQLAHALLQGLGISPRKGAPAQLVAGAALEADIGTLGTTRSDTIATDLLAAAAVAGLGDSALGTGAHFDNLHRQDARHLNGLSVYTSLASSSIGALGDRNAEIGRCVVDNVESSRRVRLRSTRVAGWIERAPRRCAAGVGVGERHVRPLQRRSFLGVVANCFRL